MRIENGFDIEDLCLKGIVPEKDKKLLQSILQDIDEGNDNLFPWTLELYIEEEHTEWSPERTDPCPDYFGMYSLRWRGHSEMITFDYVDIHGLDDTMCTIYSLFRQLEELQK